MAQRVLYQRPHDAAPSRWVGLRQYLPGLRDALVVSGLAAIARGLSLWSEPLAWVVVGAVFLYLGLWHRRTEYVPKDGGR